MDVDVNLVINKLGDQIKQMATALALKDAMVEILQKANADLNSKLSADK